MRKIGIIETGLLSEHLSNSHGDFPAMVRNWLRPVLPDYGFETTSPAKCDSFEHLECDAYVITGSPHSVYDDVAWIAPLQAFIRQCYARRTPMFGICFGHQVMASALGGKVVRHPGGWVCGNLAYSLENVPAASMLPALNISAIHQDQVIEAPGATRHHAGTDFCRFAALSYDAPMASVQFHPEFTEQFFRDLVHSKASVFSADVYDRALSSLKVQTNPQEVARYAANVLRDERG